MASTGLLSGECWLKKHPQPPGTLATLSATHAEIITAADRPFVWCFPVRLLAPFSQRETNIGARTHRKPLPCIFRPRLCASSNRQRHTHAHKRMQRAKIVMKCSLRWKNCEWCKVFMCSGKCDANDREKLQKWTCLREREFHTSVTIWDLCLKTFCWVVLAQRGKICIF